jgi:hypothetical protein
MLPHLTEFPTILSVELKDWQGLIDIWYIKVKAKFSLRTG